MGRNKEGAMCRRQQLARDLTGEGFTHRCFKLYLWRKKSWGCGRMTALRHPEEEAVVVEPWKPTGSAGFRHTMQQRRKQKLRPFRFPFFPPAPIAFCGNRRTLTLIENEYQAVHL